MVLDKVAMLLMSYGRSDITHVTEVMSMMKLKLIKILNNSTFTVYFTQDFEPWSPG